MHDSSIRLAHTGLLVREDWLPREPVDLGAIQLEYRGGAPDPDLTGIEPQTSHVRPSQSLVRPYQRYTQAIRDLDQPRLFENRASWRLLDLDWATGKGRMAFGPSSYFAAMDVYEATAHEIAYIHLDETGRLRDVRPTLRDLPFRKLIGDPFDLNRRPIVPSIDTLTIRRGANGASFVLHRRDPRRVAIAGGMLQVIPSGVFQPSSVLPVAQEADFDLWRNIMREYSEELLGNPEHDGDGQPVTYEAEPFATFNQARSDDRIQLWCLGVAIDALTLVGEILTVAVFDEDLFDDLAGNFVDANDEGVVVNTRVQFTADGVDRVLRAGNVAPAAAGCLHLAWEHREQVLQV